MRKTVLSILFIILVSVSSEAQYRFPLRISENKRYFIDADGKPFLYHADTGWQIFTQLTTPEALEYLTFRKKQGFNTIQVQLVMSPEQVNRYGHKPFLGNNDFARPDEAYYDHVVEIIAKADSMGLLIVMSQPWPGCCQEGFGGRPDKPFQANGSDRKLLVSYIPEIQPVTVNFNYLEGEEFSVKWFNPVNGTFVKELTIKGKKVQRTNMPAGEDFILLIQSL